MQKAIQLETLVKIREVIQDGYPKTPSFSGQIRISPSSNRYEDIEVYISATPRIISILDDLLLARGIIAQKGLEFLQIAVTDKERKYPISKPLQFDGIIRVSPSSNIEGDYELLLSAEHDCVCLLDKILLENRIVPLKGHQFICIRLQNPLC